MFNGLIEKLTIQLMKAETINLLICLELSASICETCKVYWIRVYILSTFVIVRKD